MGKKRSQRHKQGFTIEFIGDDEDFDDDAYDDEIYDGGEVERSGATFDDEMDGRAFYRDDSPFFSRNALIPVDAAIKVLVDHRDQVSGNNDATYWKAIRAAERYPPSTVAQALVSALLKAPPEMVSSACDALQDLPILPNLVDSIDRIIKAAPSRDHRVHVAVLRACLPSTGYSVKEGILPFLKRHKLSPDEVVAHLRVKVGHPSRYREGLSELIQAMEAEQAARERDRRKEVEHPPRPAKVAIKNAVPEFTRQMRPPSRDAAVSSTIVENSPVVRHTPDHHDEGRPIAVPVPPSNMLRVQEMEQEPKPRAWIDEIMPRWRTSKYFQGLQKSTYRFREQGVRILAGAYYQRFKELPTGWQWRDLETTLLHVLPRESDASVQLLKAIGRITGAFCDFLANELHDSRFKPYSNQIRAHWDRIFCNSWRIA